MVYIIVLKNKIVNIYNENTLLKYVCYRSKAYNPEKVEDQNNEILNNMVLTIVYSIQYNVYEVMYYE